MGPKGSQTNTQTNLQVYQALLGSSASMQKVEGGEKSHPFAGRLLCSAKNILKDKMYNNFLTEYSFLN